MGRTSRLVPALAIAMASLDGCNIYACNYKTRFIATSGAAASPAIGSVTIEAMNFRDYSGGQPVPTSLTWNIEASGLVAPVTSISLRDERDTTLVIASIPVTGSGTSGRLAAGALDLETKAERDRVFNLLSGNNGVVLVYAGAAGSPPLRLHLSVTAKENWHRPNCS
jgi:hypothetical protein